MRKVFIILSLMVCLLVLSSGCTDPQQVEDSNQATQSINLYFANQEATAVVAEKRELVNISDQEAFIKLVLEELIKGPTSEDLGATIPETVKVQALTLENNLVYVDFSEEMHTDHWRGADSEIITIISIVNTLTDLPFIEEVKMTVNSEPMNIEHMFLDEPVKRNEMYLY